MRKLKFIVDGLIIVRDPACDFSNLVPGTSEYVQVEFSFSKEWNSFVKVATFHSVMGKEYAPQALKDGKTCMVPAEALKRRIFKVRVVGKNKDGVKIQTNKVEVKQDGGEV